MSYRVNTVRLMGGKGLLLTALLVMGLVLYPLVAISQIGGARGSSTGAPITSLLNEQTCTAPDCHDDGEVNSGSGSVVIEAPMQYTPGQAVAFKVRVEEDGRQTFGFQAAVKAISDTMDFHNHVGTLEVVDAVITRIVVGNYVTHTEDGIGQNEWMVRWVAPADETRPVTIYAAGNAANGDGEDRGDHIYTTSWTMTPNTPTAIEEEPTPEAFTLDRAYPNPFSTATTIRYTLRRAAPVTLSVYDALGRRVRVLDQGRQAAGTHTVHLEAEGLSAWLYLYELRTPEARETRPMMVMR